MILEKTKKHLGKFEAWGNDIYKLAETGFKEFNTAEYINKELIKMGYSTITGKDIPYVVAVYDTSKPGPNICIFGEMDSIELNDIPTHACGHHVGSSTMLACAFMFKEYANKENICGKITFIATPAEEHIEMDYRLDLLNKGIIKYLSGKPELLYRGLLDDVDMCLMVHCMPQENEFSLSTSANGNIIKKITYYGKASHAGNAPEEGINALYAANLSLNAINALRETFREDQFARVHPIITKGGGVVNVIPDEVIMESYVRASTVENIAIINDKINTAFKGCAMALGATVKIEDSPGYFPIYTSPIMNGYAYEVAKEIFDGPINTLGHLGLCSDIGDISCVMPIIHPYIGGVSGNLHANDFKICDSKIAYSKGCAFLYELVISLLSEDGEKAKNIIDNYRPIFNSKEEYFECVSKIKNTIDF